MIANNQKRSSAAAVDKLEWRRIILTQVYFALLRQTSPSVIIRGRTLADREGLNQPWVSGYNAR